jgi:hypothetical protein
VTTLAFALRNLMRRPARTLLLILSIGLAIATALALLSLSDSIEHSTDEGARERGADFTVTQKASSDFFSGFLPMDLGPKIKAVQGVRGVAGVLVLFAPVDSENTLLYFWMSVVIYCLPCISVLECC